MVGVLNKKKYGLIISIFFLSLSILLSGCKSRRPYEFKGSTWECEEPNIVYKISDIGIETAVINTGSREIKIALCFFNGRDYVEAFYTGKERQIMDGRSDIDLVFNGTCFFGSKKFEILIGDDNIFDGAYKKLVFKRTDLDD